MDEPHYIKRRVYLTPAEDAALRDLAGDLGVSDSAYLRLLVRREAGELVTSDGQ